MANDDTTPDDDLPEVPQAPKLKRKSVLYSGPKSVLDPFKVGEIAKAAEPYIRRIPDAEGNLPYPPRDGTCEFVDPTMTRERLHGLIASSLPFTTTVFNIKGMIETFYGKLVNLPKITRGPNKVKATIPNERIVFLENKLSDLLMSNSKLANEVNFHTGQIKSLTELNALMSKNLARLEAMTKRMDDEKVNKAGTPMLEAARRNTLEKVEPLHSFTDMGKALGREPATARDRIRSRLNLPTKE